MKRQKLEVHCGKCNETSVIIRDFYVSEVSMSQGTRIALVIDYCCPCGFEGAIFATLENLLGIFGKKDGNDGEAVLKGGPK